MEVQPERTTHQNKGDTTLEHSIDIQCTADPQCGRQVVAVSDAESVCDLHNHHDIAEALKEIAAQQAHFTTYTYNN